jgi:hypothetical protein
VLAGYPNFKIDGRYVLCLDEGLGTPKDHYHSIVFWNQGFFPITEDRSGRKGVVHDCNYLPVVAIEEGNLVVLGTRSDPYVPDFLRESPEAEHWKKEREKRMRERRSEDSTRHVVAGYQTATARIVVPDAIDPATRVDESAFLNAIREILKKR